MAKLSNDSDDGGDSDGDDGEEAPTAPPAPPPAPPPASPTSARKKNSKDSSQAKRLTARSPDDESLLSPSNARKRGSRARSMDNRFEPLRDSRDFSIPISSFESLWPEGEERKVASRPCGPEKLEKTLGDASIVSVSFGGGVTPQGHLAVLTTPQFCVTGAPVDRSLDAFDRSFKTTGHRRPSQEASPWRDSRERALEERSKTVQRAPLRPSGLRQPGRRSTPVEEEESLTRALQTRRASDDARRCPLSIPKR